MFKFLSLTVIILSLSMPLLAGEGDDNLEASTSVPAKTPEGDGTMIDVPLDDEKGAKSASKKEKKKKVTVGVVASFCNSVIFEKGSL